MPSTTDAKLPSLLTRRSLPVSGEAGALVLGSLRQVPDALREGVQPPIRPNSTSTIRLAPDATSLAADHGVNLTTLPFCGRCGMGPASPM